MELKPGEHVGVDGGWPPATVGRDGDGAYYLERLSLDLRTVRREPLSEEDATAWLEDAREQQDDPPSLPTSD